MCTWQHPGLYAVLWLECKQYVLLSYEHGGQYRYWTTYCSHVVCCPPLAATGSTLCNPSNISTGLLYGHQHSTATSICGSRMIVKCHTGYCHRCRTDIRWLSRSGTGHGVTTLSSQKFNCHETLATGRPWTEKGPKHQRRIWIIFTVNNTSLNIAHRFLFVTDELFCVK